MKGHFFIDIAFKNKNNVINKHEAEKKLLYVFFSSLDQLYIKRSSIGNFNIHIYNQRGEKNCCKTR